MAMMYNLSVTSVLFYYNILGIDLKDIDINNIETRFRNLGDLTPSALYQYLPKSSSEIDTQVILLFERLCTEFGYSNQSKMMQQFYYRSVIGILNTVTSLNLVPDDDTNYLLHFERLNSILIHALMSINSLEINHLIEFFNLIRKNDLENIIKKFMSTIPVLSLLTILALNPNPNSNDYTIFESNSSTISTEKLVSLAMSPIDAKPNFKPNTNAFKRLSYTQSIEVTNINQ